jgi:hypothetical protein
MDLALHVLKRVLLMLAGYLVAVLVGLIGVAIIYGLLSFLPNAPDYFIYMGMTPLAVLFFPPVALIVYLLTIVLTAAQTIVFALTAEIFALRGLWMHALFGAVTATSGLALVAGGSVQESLPAGWTEFGVVAAAGIASGICYWLIAGRSAGFGRVQMTA